MAGHATVRRRNAKRKQCQPQGLGFCFIAQRHCWCRQKRYGAMVARPSADPRDVQSILPSRACMFSIVAVLSLLGCFEEACNWGDRRDTAQPHICAAAFAMHTMCWQAYCQSHSERPRATLNGDRWFQNQGCQPLHHETPLPNLSRWHQQQFKHGCISDGVRANMTEYFTRRSSAII